MSRPRSALFLAAASVVAVSACRGDEMLPDAPPPPDGRTLEKTSIYDLQSSLVAVDAPVNLLGVVVVALDRFGQRKGPIFVAEPGGGPYSGVYVFFTGLE